MDITQLQRLKETSKQQLQRLIKIVANERFNVFEANKMKLDRSLRLLGRSELIGKTLLDENIHSKHSRALNKSFQTELKRLRKRGLDDRANIRFVSIIHAVTDLDDDSALVEALRLKELLLDAIDAKQFSFIGAIESEVINFDKLRKFARENPDYDARKLVLCEALNSSGTNKSKFLVHIHGCLFRKAGSDFENVEKRLRDIWSHSYQVELKGLYRQFTVDKNLQKISRYITKGGQEWDNDKSSLKFKMGFTNDDLETQMSYHSKQRSQEFYDLENEVIEKDPVEDTMSLNAEEITALASFIDRLMKLENDNTGYQVIIR